MRPSPAFRPQTLVGVTAVAAVAVVWAWLGGGATAHAWRTVFGRLHPTTALELGAALVVAGLALAVARTWRLVPLHGPLGPALAPLRAAWARIPTAVILSSIVSVVAVCRISLGASSHTPKVLGDELIYVDVAKSWVTEGRPLLRGVSDIGHSTLYPLFLAPAFALAGDGASALAAARVLDAVAIALTAVPAFLLARRFLPRGWALGVAALSVAVPWTAYAALTMTESLFYPVFVAFAAALAWTLEEPTWRRQVLTLGLFAVLIGVRAQGLAVGAAAVAAIVVHAALEGRVRELPRRYRPLLAAAVLVLVVAVGAAVAGVAVPTSAYNPVFDSLGRLWNIAKWGVWSLGTYDLALGVVLFTAFPPAVRAMMRRAAPPAARAAGVAAASLFLGLLASVALLGASPYGLGVLHERNLFFATPLVLACAAYWLHAGLPRRPVPAATWALLSVGAVASVPTRLVLERTNSVDLPSSAFFRALHDREPSVEFRIWALAIAIAGVLAFLVARRPLFPVLATVLAFAAVTAQIDYRDGLTRTQAQALSWVDRALPSGTRATMVYEGLPRTADACGELAQNEQQMLSTWTEYFNRNVSRVAYLYAVNAYDGLAAEQLDTASGGLVVRDGQPFAPAYAILDTRQPIVGTRVARFDLESIGAGYENGSSLTLWKVDPPLRLYDRADPLPPRGDGRPC